MAKDQMHTIYASSRSLKFHQLKFPITEPLNIKPGMFVFNPAMFWFRGRMNIKSLMP